MTKGAFDFANRERSALHAIKLWGLTTLLAYASRKVLLLANNADLLLYKLIEVIVCEMF